MINMVMQARIQTLEPVVASVAVVLVDLPADSMTSLILSLVEAEDRVMQMRRVKVPIYNTVFI